MALKKSEIYSTLTKCTNKLRSNSGIGAESFKNYVLILLFLKYVSDRKKSGEQTVLEIPEGCTFDDIVAMKGMKGETRRIPCNNKEYSSIGDGINKIIAAITEANGLQDVINLESHDFCAKGLGTVGNSASIISELVSAFQDDGLDFSQNRAADDDLIGDAYEFLMRNFASQAGRDKGQFYTPTEVSRLIAFLVGIDLDERQQVSAYDPTCGSGSLLLRIRAAAKHNVSLFGQDIDHANIELSYLNTIIHGCETADIRHGDTLNNPLHTKNGKLETFNYVVSNPKFSLHNWMNGAKENDIYNRWNKEIGVPPQNYGDYAFLLHCLTSLKDDGVCAIILPNGTLTRGGDEEKLRKWLVEQHLISGIISFPQNAFFGTTIAGNVFILDKKGVDDGVFFIDGSELGYKDADSKIRLREQDIKRITDVWRARKDVQYFAHLATYEKVQHDGEEIPTYEIEHNKFALNLSLYVTPEDKEIHQDIEAHLHGGIPVNDIERMQKYWEACPTLKNTLFKPLREGFVQLAIDKNAISETIEQDNSFQNQAKVYESTLSEWCNTIRPEMLAIDMGNDPKSNIAQWGQSILDTFMPCKALVNAYDVYDQLLIYYNESMQDDLYMISNGGWMPTLIIPAKKTIKWTDLTCDLLPVDLVVKVFLKDIKEKLDKKENELSQLQEKMASLVEDNEDDFSESDYFFGKLNEANLKKALKGECTEEHKKLWKQYLGMIESEKKVKKEVKELSDKLLHEILRVYQEMTPESAKQTIVNDKWLADISERITKEMETVTHNISAEVNALVKRYEYTLGALNESFNEKEDAVLDHLKEMGFEL